MLLDLSWWKGGQFRRVGGAVKIHSHVPSLSAVEKLIQDTRDTRAQIVNRDSE